jgi:hypothetical protein
MQRDVMARLAVAQRCCPSCGALPCTAVVAGICCPVLVNRAEDWPATQEYLAALKAFQAECDVACPDIVCRVPQLYNCATSPNGGAACY